MIEEWRAVGGYEGLYEVSSRGRVRSLRSKELMRPYPMLRGGYPAVNLSSNGKKLCPVHRLVAEAFIGPRPPGADIRHLDGNPANARASNLCYGTRKDNERDKDRHGRRPLGIDHHAAKLNPDKILRAKKMHAAGTSLAIISRTVGAAPSTLYAMFAGRTWSHAVRPARAHLGLKTKLAAALLCLGDENGQLLIDYEHSKSMTVEQIISLFQWDHRIPRAEGGSDEHWNIEPKLI